MSFLPTITLLDGTLRENETIELYADFSGDSLAHLHPQKSWTVFSEKNINYSVIQERYYYLTDNDGEVFTATNSDNIQIKKLKPGRLFAIFEYRDYYGVWKEVVKTFNVAPLVSVTVASSITSGDTAEFTSETSLSNIKRTWTFEDDGVSLSGADVSKSFDVDGYYDVSVLFDYTSATHPDGSNVVWKSTPEDKIVGAAGPYGNGTIVTTGLSAVDATTELITAQYLVKYDIDADISLSINFSNSVDNTLDAPLRSIVTDESTYGLGITGDNRIEYLSLEYGDGINEKFQDLNFDTTKVYQRSGEYNGTFTVHTVHETSTGATYRQTSSTAFVVTVNPFFTKWLKDHLNSVLFNSEGFKDLATAWGTQMDRVYNEAQVLIDSIDAAQIDEKFLRGFANTYGDFPEIFERIGFVGFSEGRSDRFKYLNDYNFFDRIVDGDLSADEKKEFVNYIQERRIDLQKKGTLESIEKTIARFALSASVVELWAESYKPRDKVPLIDRVFGGDDIINNTGIRARSVATPLSNNIQTTIVSGTDNSYIEINTHDKNKMQYNTSDKTTKVIAGKTYVVFERD